MLITKNADQAFGPNLQGEILVLLSGADVYLEHMRYPKSDHCNEDVFFNPGISGMKSLWMVLKWKLQGTQAKWPDSRNNSKTPSVATDLKDGELSTTFINHATHLVQLKGINVITDPVFSERVSPFSWLGPKRVHRPGIELNRLPPIHVVLVSHNHYDHMDFHSIASLAKRYEPLFVTPIGNGHLLESMGAKKIVELDWWQETKLEGTNLEVVLVPAQHWSRRGLSDTNKALWGGFVIRTQERKIYFAGDTGYGAFFKEIRQRLGVVSLSLLPIGAYAPRWFMKTHHMNPEDAVRAHLDLESQMSLGTHFGTFQLTDEGLDDPAKELGEALKRMTVAESTFLAPQPGQTHFFGVGERTPRP